jgi:hypothetical protein
VQLLQALVALSIWPTPIFVQWMGARSISRIYEAEGRLPFLAEMMHASETF